MAGWCALSDKQRALLIPRSVATPENSVARARTLAYLAQTAAKLLEIGDLEGRLHEVESALEPRLHATRR
jgi:hypothetical protein